jgi:hypothetical protein
MTGILTDASKGFHNLMWDHQSDRWGPSRVGRLIFQARNMAFYGLVLQAGAPLAIGMFASVACQNWSCEDDGFRVMTKYRPLSAAVVVASCMLTGYAGLFTYRAWQAPTFQAMLRPAGTATAALIAHYSIEPLLERTGLKSAPPAKGERQR